MLDKLKKLLNVKAWAESFVARMVLDKGVKHATTAIVGLLSSGWFVAKVAPILTQYGVNIDPIAFQAGVAAALSGVAGWLINWAQKAMNKDTAAPASTPAA